VHPCTSCFAEGVRQTGVQDQLLGLAVLIRKEEVGPRPAEDADVSQLGHARGFGGINHRGVLGSPLAHLVAGDQ
jgi:hypothetical protein